MKWARDIIGMVPPSAGHRKCYSDITLFQDKLRIIRLEYQLSVYFNTEMCRMQHSSLPNNHNYKCWNRPHLWTNSNLTCRTLAPLSNIDIKDDFLTDVHSHGLLMHIICINIIR